MSNHKRSKKYLSLSLAAMLLLSLFAGCGGGGGSTPPADSTAPAGEAAASESGGESAAPAQSGSGETLTWLSQGPGEGSWEERTAPILETYQAATGTQVIGEFYPFNDLFEVIEVKIASGSSEYDVISVDVPMVAAYATRGYLAPMDEYFTAEEKAGFIPSAVDAGSWDGVFYAPPMNTSSQLLWYNNDILSEAGVTVRDSDVNNRLTYEEVVEMANQALDVVDPDRNQGVAGLMFQQVSRTYQLCALPNSLGEPSIGSDGYTVDGVLNSEGWVKAMSWYQDLYNNNLSLRGITADETKDYFAAGKIIFMVGGTWTYADHVNNMDLGWAPVPAFAGYEDKVGTPTGSWHFGINKASQNYDSAADFIKYFSLGEGNDMWLQINSDVPSTMKAIEAIQNDDSATEIQKIAAFEAANTAVPRALTPGYNEYSSYLDAALEDIRNGTDVQSALNSAVSQITSAMEKYR